MALVKIRFEWDPKKAASNLQLHGVAFENTEPAFLDPYKHVELDPCEYEERWRTTGMLDNMLILFIAHTSRDEDGTEVIRIISERKATRRERKTYYGNR